MQYLGEVLSVLAAILWAFAVILFKKSGETVHPIALNLFKNLMAMVLFIPTMLMFGISLTTKMPEGYYFILFLSGVIGIGIGDTLFLKSLNLLGASLTGIVYCLYSPFTIILAYLWLGESLTILQVFGAFLIVSAVIIATYKKGGIQISRERILWGILFAVIANIAFAVGIVMFKPLLLKSPLLLATEVRLIGGIIALFLILLFHPSRKVIIRSLISKGSWYYTITGSFIGAYLSMIVWLSGMKYTQVSIASALNQTNIVFIFILAAIILKEPIDWKRSIGVTFAVIGAFFVSLG